jgi:intein/homing endonuclease
MFCITEKDILEVYKEEGKVKEYNYCRDYLKFMNMKTKKTIKEVENKFCVGYNSLMRWKHKRRLPYGIKNINFLKEKKLLPYYPNEITARIVGFLHGDGYLNNSLGSFGFVSKDKDLLLMIKKDVEKEFKIQGKLKKKRDKGDVESINGKKYFVKYPTYEINIHSKAISSLLFKLGVPRGKKIYQNNFVPEWILSGNKKIQKAFLQGLFDSELANSSISTYERHENNLGSPRMEMGKTKELEGNLRQYLQQIIVLLKSFKIESSTGPIRDYREGKVSLTLVISNKLINIYNFIEKVGFYYNIPRMKRAKYIKKLALEKIKGKNALYKILNYCKNKETFVSKDLEFLEIATSSSQLWSKYLEKYHFVTRKRIENRRFKYFPNLNKINKIIKNPLLLEELPKLTHMKNGKKETISLG